MKFIESYFKVPTRMYDALDFKNQQMAGIEGGPLPYRIGGETLMHLDIVGWKAMRFREAEGEEGFPCTVIKMKDGDDILCVWPIKKFEAELQLYAEKFEKWVEEEQEERAEEITGKLLNKFKIAKEKEEDLEL